MTKENIQEWFDSPMEERRKAEQALQLLREEYPYCYLTDWMLSLIAEDPYKDWYALHSLTLVHPVFYVKELENANTIVLPEEEIVDDAIIEDVQELISNEHIEKIIEEKETGVEEEKSNLGTEDFVKVAAGDYFFEETQKMPSDLHTLAQSFKSVSSEEERRPVNEDQSLMVVMSFAEWLHYMHELSVKEAEEKESQRALKAMWQKEKLPYEQDEAEEEIPEEVFNMAVNSIRLDEEIVSESMAHVYMKQEKWSQAIEIYTKLSLRNPEKSLYFAEQIKDLEQKLSL